MNATVSPIVSSSSKAPQLATKREIARFLQVTPRTIETYQRQGLPHYRLGPRRNRYDLDAVKKWLEARR